jgi:hypothetical protein
LFVLFFTIPQSLCLADDGSAIADRLIDALTQIGGDPLTFSRIKHTVSPLVTKPDPKTEAKAAEIPRSDKYWAFRPIARPPVPVTSMPAWVANPIDAFILESLDERNLKPSPPADRRTLLRRVYLDVLGLPPTPEEMDAFVNDASPDAYERLVERALASPHYGERWARHWLDVVGFAETNGFETNTPRRNAWHYRDYVIQSLNDDKPYDQFVREQIAGDALGAPAATGFLVAGPMDEVKSPDIVLTRNQRDQELHNMTSAVGGAFLGLTVGCAKCHEHKFDPISQADYYSMRAVFAGVKHGEQTLPDPQREEKLAKANELRRELASLKGKLIRHARLEAPDGARPAVSAIENIERFAPVEAKFVRFTVRKTSTIEPCIDELEVFTADEHPVNVALAAAGSVATASSEFPSNEKHKTVHLNDGRYGNDYSWIPTEREGAWAQIEFAVPARIDTIAWGRDRDGGYKDRLPIDYVIEVALEQGDWRVVASSEGRTPFVEGQKHNDPFNDENLAGSDSSELKEILERRRELREAIGELLAAPKMYAGVFEEPDSTHVLYRGDPMQEREEVVPASLTHVGDPLRLPPYENEQTRRLKLADWIVSKDNPLTARVIVNRIWQHHFGRGIVDTPSDFGAMGARPTHPKLLDWLAHYLMDNGWRMKEVHRVILLSNTYRQSSAPNPGSLSFDADSRLLWRFPPRRLEMEPIRDSILYVSGQLDLTMGGPGFDVFEPDNSYVHIYIPKQTFTRTEFRRMIYQWKPRMEQDITFGIFDCPDASQSMPKRNVSTSPLQAFSLLNSPFLIQQAQLFADRIIAEVGTDPTRQGHCAFALAFNRAPDGDESAQATLLIESHGLAALCRAIYNASEFLYLN